MARIRTAKPEEVEQTLFEQYQSFLNALLFSRSAPRTIRSILKRVGRVERFWRAWLDFQLNVPRKKLDTLRKIIPSRARALARSSVQAVHPINVKKWKQFSDDLKQTVLEMEGQPIPTENTYLAYFFLGLFSKGPFDVSPAPFLRALTSGNPAQPRRYKKEYLEAYRERLTAAHKGEVITTPRLVAKYRSRPDDENFDSDVRGMQRALRRVEKEHQRCFNLNIPFPPDNPFPLPPPPKTSRPKQRRK